MERTGEKIKSIKKQSKNGRRTEAQRQIDLEIMGYGEGSRRWGTRLSYLNNLKPKGSSLSKLRLVSTNYLHTHRIYNIIPTLGISISCSSLSYHNMHHRVPAPRDSTTDEIWYWRSS